MKIAIAGTGYVGLSNGVLLSQHNEVVALDIVPEKVAMLNRKESPIQDVELEDYLKNKPLNFRATLDKQDAFEGATTSSLPPYRLRPRDQLLQHPIDRSRHSGCYVDQSQRHHGHQIDHPCRLYQKDW
jgi:hypothetical protein